jgi:hypothetical protein
MFLEHVLLERNTGLLVTGLGGQGDRLRYLVLVRSMDGITFTSAQETMVRSAFPHVCRRHNSIFEEIEVWQKGAVIEMLVPMDVAVGAVIEAGIAECNTYVRFLDDDYYVTNVEIPSRDQVRAFIGS